MPDGGFRLHFLVDSASTLLQSDAATWVLLPPLAQYIAASAACRSALASAAQDVVIATQKLAVADTNFPSSAKVVVAMASRYDSANVKTPCKWMPGCSMQSSSPP